MSIEGFNNSTRNKKESNLTGLMTATEARKQLNDAVTTLAADEVAKALEAVKASVTEGKNTTIFAFKHNAPEEVIDAAIAMLKHLQYDVTVGEFYSNVIHITLPTE